MEDFEISQILEDLVLMRFKTKKDIQVHLQNCFKEFDEDIKIPPIEDKTRYDDETEFDFNLIGVIQGKDLLVDFDIYYLKDNVKQYFITEIGYEYQ